MEAEEEEDYSLSLRSAAGNPRYPSNTADRDPDKHRGNIVEHDRINGFTDPPPVFKIAGINAHTPPNMNATNIARMQRNHGGPGSLIATNVAISAPM